MAKYTNKITVGKFGSAGEDCAPVFCNGVEIAWIESVKTVDPSYYRSTSRCERDFTRVESYRVEFYDERCDHYTLTFDTRKQARAFIDRVVALFPDLVGKHMNAGDGDDGVRAVFCRAQPARLMAMRAAQNKVAA